MDITEENENQVDTHKTHTRHTQDTHKNTRVLLGNRPHLSRKKSDCGAGQPT